MFKKNYFYGLMAFILAGMVIVSCADLSKTAEESKTTSVRAPAYPLITIDPYTSAWSMTDKLFNSPVKHWTEKNHSMIGAVRVNGEVYRFLGEEDIPLKTVVPNAKEEPWDGKYTFDEPADNWSDAGFNDASWKDGQGGFGTPGHQDSNTEWTNESIWVRREFVMPEVAEGSDIYLIYSHDDDFELYLNGEEIVNTGNRARREVVLKVDKEMLNMGSENTIAAHCLDRGGLAYVDFGIFTDSDQEQVFKNTAVQNSVSMSATQTHYNFTCGPVDLDIQFVSPLIPHDLELLSRPVNYINYEVTSNDENDHEVQIYFEITPEWAVNQPVQEVEVTNGEVDGVNFVKAGTVEQPVLEKRGDDLRIDWGYAYLASPKDESISVGMGDFFSAKKAFIENGNVDSNQQSMKTRLVEQMPAMYSINNVGNVSSKSKKGFVMLGYDDIESIQYFGDNVKAWWTNQGQVSFDEVLTASAKNHDAVMQECVEFDNKLWDETVEAGGKEYADLCVLAYRQSVAAHKLVKDTNGEILFLSKENNSNGSIGTVDVTYPSAPLYLYYNPELLKGMLNPIFYYSESGKWSKEFAPHDVGTYPLANGQTYGGDMPIEETGNMLILTAAIADREGNAEYAQEHWDILTQWANYLHEYGLDPENQLCTDDFAGHFAHNANLSVKAIMGIASYGSLAKMLGKDDIAENYTNEAKSMAKEWMEMADDGDHYRLTFDRPDTWSQKYNLVWDKLLDFGIFPDEVAQKEIEYYKTKQNEYGLPLDNRRTYTKADWVVWTATLANNQEDFQTFIEPLHDFATETKNRVPLTDWYETPNADQVGFKARSVVGGFFIKLLEE
jgi:hypothetical protein